VKETVPPDLTGPRDLDLLFGYRQSLLREVGALSVVLALIYGYWRLFACISSLQLSVRAADGQDRNTEPEEPTVVRSEKLHSRFKRPVRPIPLSSTSLFYCLIAFPRFTLVLGRILLESGEVICVCPAMFMQLWYC